MAGPLIQIAIANHQKRVRLSERKAARLTEKILKLLGWKRVGLSLVFVNDSEIRRLNREFLGEDQATDVLAFGQMEKFFPEPERPFLGDIVISVETARRAAPRFGSRWDEEVLLYICHGILHLMGYRDGSPRLKAQMEEKQRKILKKILGSQWPSKRPKRLF